MHGTPGTSKRFDIRVKKTARTISHWGAVKKLYQAGASFNDGYWEPAALQLPSDELCRKTIPFDVPANRYPLRNSLCITKGDTIIAVTSTKAYSKNASEIWMIKRWIQ